MSVRISQRQSLVLDVADPWRIRIAASYPETRSLQLWPRARACMTQAQDDCDERTDECKADRGERERRRKHDHKALTLNERDKAQDANGGKKQAKDLQRTEHGDAFARRARADPQRDADDPR